MKKRPSPQYPSAAKFQTQSSSGSPPAGSKGSISASKDTLPETATTHSHHMLCMETSSSGPWLINQKVENASLAGREKVPASKHTLLDGIASHRHRMIPMDESSHESSSFDSNPLKLPMDKDILLEATVNLHRHRMIFMDEFSNSSTSPSPSASNEERGQPLVEESNESKPFFPGNVMTPETEDSNGSTASLDPLDNDRVMPDLLSSENLQTPQDENLLPSSVGSGMTCGFALLPSNTTANKLLDTYVKSQPHGETSKDLMKGMIPLQQNPSLGLTHPRSPTPTVLAAKATLSLAIGRETPSTSSLSSTVESTSVETKPRAEQLTPLKVSSMLPRENTQTNKEPANIVYEYKHQSATAGRSLYASPPKPTPSFSSSLTKRTQHMRGAEGGENARLGKKDAATSICNKKICENILKPTKAAKAAKEVKEKEDKLSKIQQLIQRTKVLNEKVIAEVERMNANVDKAQMEQRSVNTLNVDKPQHRQERHPQTPRTHAGSYTETQKDALFHKVDVAAAAAVASQALSRGQVPAGAAAIPVIPPPPRSLSPIPKRLAPDARPLPAAAPQEQTHPPPGWEPVHPPGQLAAPNSPPPYVAPAPIPPGEMVPPLAPLPQHQHPGHQVKPVFLLYNICLVCHTSF